ncbi:uncharacterized protein LOC128891287 [Hylaeus anthracinus]|uniref:uncharacterized protein LOC128891287 n=1 Tax=Hylaeus anthracinus TaxID=313031 RepID=UPI0023B935A2|nr:uncharacterized protein LOC128891287 [Hylaeus anthracinus]
MLFRANRHGAKSWTADMVCYIFLQRSELARYIESVPFILISEGRSSEEAENLTFTDRLKLVQRFPVVVARQFTVRVNVLMQYIKDTQCLHGVVIDYWYRIEFQNRGSPHLHLLIWCANIPDFLTNEGVNVIENVVSCSIETAEQDTDKRTNNVPRS